MDDQTKYHINPTGRFVTGGPQGDSGLTGRKIIVDTYGGYAPHGGGAFSGKDPTKVDRSAAYMARYVAKNIVAAGSGGEMSGATGLRDRRGRTGFGRVDTHGTGRIGEAELSKLVREHFALTPKEIIEQLKLRRPIYRADGRLRSLRSHGRRLHLGRDRQGRGTTRGRRSLEHHQLFIQQFSEGAFALNEYCYARF